jgi:predicted GNAT superfamily acetyltransferase
MTDTRSLSGFDLRPLTSATDFDLAVALQRAVWGADFTDLVPPAILHIVQFVGGVAAGAFTEDGELAGFIFGVSGIRDGRLSHWSDTLAVRAEYRDRGLGERLKRFQRDLLLPLGIERMHWTFDPLESRNAHLNFNRLGATASEYHRDFYGETSSVLHEDIGTDRLVVCWEIGAPHVAALLDHGARSAVTADDVRDVPLINETSDGVTGPESDEPNLHLDAPRVRLAIPADIQQLKSRSPELAREWRRVTRLAFESYLARAYVARALVRRGAHSEYILERSAR